MSGGISSVSMMHGIGNPLGGSMSADVLSLDNGDRFIVLKQVGLSLILNGVEREAAANARQIALALKAAAEELELKAAAEELEWTLAKPVPEAAVQS